MNDVKRRMQMRGQRACCALTLAALALGGCAGGAGGAGDLLAEQSALSAEPAPALAPASGHAIEVRQNAIYLDGVPTLFRAATLQWFKLPRETWEDRILRLKATGYNTLDMYVAWMLHEPEEGRFDFATHDLRHFLDLAAKHGMFVYFRPGPYITNEMDGGGVPAWVFAKSGKTARDAVNADGIVNLRTNDRDYLDLVQRYFGKLNEVIRPYLFTRGGPIVLYSVENEYNWFLDAFSLEKGTKLNGAAERDPRQVPDVAGYLAALRDIVRAQGVDVPITTSPGNVNVSGMDGVSGIIPMPNYYWSNPLVEHGVWQHLRDMHDPRNHGGSYANFPSGATETSRTSSILRRLVVSGLDLISQFNQAGCHQEAPLNGIAMKGSEVRTLSQTLDYIRANTVFSLRTLGTAFFRPLVGYFHTVFDFNGAVSPSGALKEKFYSLRRTNLFLEAFGPVIAQAGESRRTSRNASLPGMDLSVKVLHPALGTLDPDAKKDRVNYWLPLGARSALIGLYNDGAREIRAGRGSVEAFGMTFPRFSELTVPIEQNDEFAPGVNEENEYSMLLPVNLELGAGFTLAYSTSEILTRLASPAGVTLVVYGKAGTTGELSIRGQGLEVQGATGAVRLHEQDAGTVTLSFPNEDVQSVRLGDGAGHKLEIIVVADRTAGRAWLLPSSRGTVIVFGPDYVEARDGQLVFEADVASSGPVLVRALSQDPISLAGLTLLSPYDESTGLSVYEMPIARPAVAIRADISRGKAKDDMNESRAELDTRDFIDLGDRPVALERLGIYSGHAWYRGEFTLDAAEAKKPGRLWIDSASDFVGLYVNGLYLTTLCPLGTEVNNQSKDASYGFPIPASVLREGKNTLAIRNEIWGHGSFMWPRGTVGVFPLPGMLLSIPGMRASLPALGFDSLRGVIGNVRFNDRPVTGWRLKKGLTGVDLGYPSKDFDDRAWRDTSFPLRLSPGQVVWYRARFGKDELPDPRQWFAPLALTLQGKNAKATLYLNGRMIGRWLSDDGWLQRGTWTQSFRSHLMNTEPDDFPLAQERLTDQNVLAIAFEDAGDGRDNGLVEQVRLILARENRLYTPQGIEHLPRLHQRFPVRLGD